MDCSLESKARFTEFLDHCVSYFMALSILFQFLPPNKCQLHSIMKVFLQSFHLTSLVFPPKHTKTKTERIAF